MAGKKVRVDWSKAANSQFNEILEYLHLESQSAVVIVRKAILDAINQMSKNPTANHPTDLRKTTIGILGPVRYSVTGFPIMLKQMSFIFCESATQAENH